jgi:hypothetical protein
VQIVSDNLIKIIASRTPHQCNFKMKMSEISENACDFRKSRVRFQKMLAISENQG